MIVVTGLMRSGTSILSEKLHRMGVPMGSLMMFPVAGDDTGLEWEDVEFSVPLASMLCGTRDLDVPEFFRSYIAKRSGSVGAWGVKSPFLLPYLHEFKRVAAEMDFHVTVILTKRDISETMKSLEARYVHLPRPDRRRAFKLSERLQRRIYSRWNEHADGAEVFDICDTFTDLASVEARLRVIAGLSCDRSEV